MWICYNKCSFLPVAVESQYTVSIVRSPSGSPVAGQPNTFDYSILSSVTLSCVATSSSGSRVSASSYRWNTENCYTNHEYRNGRPDCFPNGQTTQTVTGNDLAAQDSGTITCTARISSTDYTSGPMSIRIRG